MKMKLYKKAFSLIEILFVITIIGILSMFALIKNKNLNTKTYEAKLKELNYNLNNFVFPLCFVNKDKNITKYIKFPKYFKNFKNIDIDNTLKSKNNIVNIELNCSDKWHLILDKNNNKIVFNTADYNYSIVLCKNTTIKPITSLIVFKKNNKKNWKILK